ncbi:MAG: c-type cytochrome [Myxococcota bacterium]
MKRQWLALPALVALLACEPAQRSIGPGSHPQSGTVQISRDGRLVFVLSEDHKAVFVHDRESGQTLRQVEVGEGPVAMTLMDDGKLAVANKLDGTVSLVNPDGAEENRIAVGTEPTALVQRGDKLVVVLSGDHALAEVDPRAGQVTRTIPLQLEHPRGIALLANGDIYVTHFYAGRIAVVDMEAGAVTRHIPLNMPSNPLLYPNQLSSMTTNPDGDEVSAPHNESNNDPGNLQNGGQNTGAYYVQGPSGMPAVVGSIATVDTRTHVATSDTDKPTFATCSTCGNGNTTGEAPKKNDPSVAAPPPSVFNVLDPRFGDALMNGPVAVAYVDGGRGKMVVFRGTNNVMLMRTRVYGDQNPMIAQFPVGAGANGIAVSPDGKKAYVWSQFDYKLHEIDVPMVEEPTTKENSLGVAGPDQSAKSQQVTNNGNIEKRGTARDLLVTSVRPLSPAVERGRRLFFDATNPALTFKGAVSCQGCHPDGRSDGMRWTFGTAKIRNTPQLGGRISETAPFHWDGDRPEKASMNMTVEFFMAGTGLAENQIEDLFSFIDTIPVARSPVVGRAELAASIARGAEIFFSTETRCADCHTGNLYTDNLAWDVGTSNLEQGVRFGTPVLAGVAASAPYFHDGREDAATLEQMVDNYVRTDKMGVGSHLNDQQARDLVNFLKSL